jgi:hypothetical protein
MKIMRTHTKKAATLSVENLEGKLLMSTVPSMLSVQQLWLYRYEQFRQYQLSHQTQGYTVVPPPSARPPLLTARSVPVSTIGSTPISHPAAAAHPSTTVLKNGLSMSLSLDKSNYSLGSPVNMTFTDTNVSSSPVKVLVGPSIDGFIVSKNGTRIWRSNPGPQPWYVVNRTLLPGQSFTFKATWTATTTGTLTVSHESAPNGPSVTFTVS